MFVYLLGLALANPCFGSASPT